MDLNSCAIALGSNLGDSEAILTGAIAALNRSPEIRVKARSAWYQTKAVTLPNSPPQPDYLNGCALLETTLTPHQLLRQLQQIETEFGRSRHQRWEARTLDLDLLLFDDVVLNTPDLELPHPRMCDRAFVLVPLAEIAPDWVHPIANCSIAQLADRVDLVDVQQRS